MKAVSDLDRAVRELARDLGRPITLNGAIIQHCPLCEVELRMCTSVLRDAPERLHRELFYFYDQHRCYATPNEDTFQRAERAFVQLAEHALGLAAAGKSSLAARAELESQRLVEWVDSFRRCA